MGTGTVEISVTPLIKSHTINLWTFKVSDLQPCYGKESNCEAWTVSKLAKNFMVSFDYCCNTQVFLLPLASCPFLREK